MPEDNTKVTRSPRQPFAEKGSQLGYANDLKARGLWPPRLHNRKDNNDNDRKPVATPFLIIPATAADNGARPLPNTQAFYSQSIWIEDNLGNLITTPAIGNEYIIKCRILNIGAFASYGGLVDFYVNPPGVFNALAGTTGPLRAFGHTGFSVDPGRFKDVICPVRWRPLTDDDLLAGILVQAYDPFTDMLTSRFDARNDRHVGRHDYTSDFYVRDWTSSVTIHDMGNEPSSDPWFYVRSDVWNRRVNDPGTFVNDQPSSQDPQAGTGAAGDNFIFARISRNNATTQETVKAHFLFAEFGTGSPYLDCSGVPDPSVTFLPGETSKLISLPWNLHPSSSPHLCIAVQIYSDADTYMAPGLLGYTPGWPTTDLMVINDNNKAQRNIKVWDGVPDEPGMHFAMIYNSATYIRDFELSVSAPSETMRRFTNATVRVHGSDYAVPLKDGATIKVPQMLPGERRWVTFGYDSFSAGKEENLTVAFNEMAEGRIINGFGISINTISEENVILPCLELQQAAFSRMDALGVKYAQKGLAFCQRLLESKPGPGNYLLALPELSQLLLLSVAELSTVSGGLKDDFGITENIGTLPSFNDEKRVTAAIAFHHILLNQLDAWLTTAVKREGDEASVLFTVRLQKDLFRRQQCDKGECHQELIQATEKFITDYSRGKVSNKEYPALVRYSLDSFQLSTANSKNKILRDRLQDLSASLDGTVAGTQKAHLAFLNDLARSYDLAH